MIIFHKQTISFYRNNYPAIYKVFSPERNIEETKQSYLKEKKKKVCPLAKKQRKTQTNKSQTNRYLHLATEHVGSNIDPGPNQPISAVDTPPPAFQSHF